MDIQLLLDRLEEALNESTRVPLSAYLLVNEDKIFSIVDQMRVAVPEEVKRASRVEAEKDRIMAQAKEEADRIRELARQEADELVKRDNIIVAAQQRADHVMDRAARDADGLRQDADVYVVDVLNGLEEDLLRVLNVVRNGLHKVQAEQAERANNQQPVE
ncbi:MAG: hypothetical protein R3C44_07370 [Chloroflexota bacterium]